MERNHQHNQEIKFVKIERPASLHLTMQMDIHGVPEIINLCTPDIHLAGSSVQSMSPKIERSSQFRSRLPVLALYPIGQDQDESQACLLLANSARMYMFEQYKLY